MGNGWIAATAHAGIAENLSAVEGNALAGRGSIPTKFKTDIPTRQGNVFQCPRGPCIDSNQLRSTEMGDNSSDFMPSRAADRFLLVLAGIARDDAFILGSFNALAGHVSIPTLHVRQRSVWMR